MMSAVGLLCRIMFMRQAAGGSVLFLAVEGDLGAGLIATFNSSEPEPQVGS